MTDHGNNSEAKNHKKIFVVVFLMLCALTAMSFWISRSYLMDDVLTGWLAMMAVSVAKASLVILFFMHLWWERAWKWVLTIPSLIMGTLLVLLLVPDIAYRTDRYSKSRTSYAAESQQGEMTTTQSSTDHE